jgi:hypothetical protein
VEGKGGFGTDEGDAADGDGEDGDLRGAGGLGDAERRGRGGREPGPLVADLAAGDVAKAGWRRRGGPPMRRHEVAGVLHIPLERLPPPGCQSPARRERVGAGARHRGGDDEEGFCRFWAWGFLQRR